MIKRYSKLFQAIHFAGDIFLLNLALILAYYTRWSYETYPLEYHDKYTILYLVFNLVWVASASALNIYEIYRVISIEKVIQNLIKSLFLHLLLTGVIITSLRYYHLSREYLVISYIYFCILITLFRTGFLIMIRLIRSRGINFRTAVIIGTGPVATNTIQYLKSHPEYGFKLLGFFADSPDDNNSKEVYLGSYRELYKYAETQKIDEIFCTLPLIETEKIRELMNFTDNNLIRFKIVPDLRGLNDRKVVLDFYDELPVMHRRSEPLESKANSFIKRCFDIIFSVFTIVAIISWLSPVIAAMIKLSSNGPVFFRQKRSGKINEEFWCLKFRTMRVNEVSDEMQATENDTRITRIGKFLRKTSLDELPQFFNVLIGNMSVVGPRPHMLRHTEEYSKMIDKFMVRHLVKPGITGLAQVYGFRGETSETKQMGKRVQYDLWYIENWSFLLDIKIIFLTIFNMFRRDQKAF